MRPGQPRGVRHGPTLALVGVAGGQPAGAARPAARDDPRHAARPSSPTLRPREAPSAVRRTADADVASFELGGVERREHALNERAARGPEDGHHRRPNARRGHDVPLTRALASTSRAVNACSSASGSCSRSLGIAVTMPSGRSASDALSSASHTATAAFRLEAPRATFTTRCATCAACSPSKSRRTSLASGRNAKT